MVFKSKYEIEIPQTDFYNYVIGDITGHEESLSVVCGLTHQKYTYAKVKEYSERMGTSLLERGYRKGDVIAIYSPNCPEYIFTLLGCAKVGITCTLVNPLANPTEIQYQLEKTRARALFVFPLFAQQAFNAKSSVPRIRDIYLYGMPYVVKPALELFKQMFQAVKAEHRACWLFNDLIKPSRGARGFIRSPWMVEEIEFQPDKDVCILPYSSGTTGLPKGVEHTHQTLISWIDIIYQHSGVADVVRRNSNHFNTLALLPLFHIFGFASVIVGLKYRGTIVMNPRFKPELFLRTIQKYKISFIPLVPPLVNFLARHPLCDSYNLTSIRLLFSGGAPLTKAAADAVLTRYPNLEVVQALGMTEGMISCTIDEGVPYTSVGQLMPNNKLKIIDIETKQELDHNEVGEIVLQSPSTMVGYYNNPEATMNSFMIDENGEKWMYTGDVGYVDDHGNLYLVDRIKEMIKYKGHQVSPVEVEHMLCQIDGVVDAAIIGLPDEDAGELPMAFVVKKEGSNLNGEEVFNYVRDNMTVYNQLKGGVRFIDTIPRSIAGKIQRRDLKKMAQDTQVAEENQAQRSDKQ